jgi:hypothetical protein
MLEVCISPPFYQNEIVVRIFRFLEALKSLPQVLKHLINDVIFNFFVGEATGALKLNFLFLIASIMRDSARCQLWPTRIQLHGPGQHPGSCPQTLSDRRPHSDVRLRACCPPTRKRGSRWSYRSERRPGSATSQFVGPSRRPGPADRTVSDRSQLEKP